MCGRPHRAPTPGHHCGCSAPTTGVGRVGSYPVLASATCSATTEDSARVRSPRTPRAVGDHARYRPTSLPPGCSRSSSDRTEPRSTTRTPAPHQHQSQLLITNHRPGGRRSLLPNPRTPAPHQHQSQLLITNHLPPHTPQPPTRRPPLITAEPAHPGAASAPVPTPHHQPPPSTHTSTTDQAAAAHYCRTRAPRRRISTSPNSSSPTTSLHTHLLFIRSRRHAIGHGSAPGPATLVHDDHLPSRHPTRCHLIG